MSEIECKWDLPKVREAFEKSLAHRDEMIGFLLAAIDDEMISLKEGWTLASDEQLRQWCTDAFVDAAVAIKQGKVLPSELRGSKPFGIA